jgi:CRP-like cAMP-binding protein
MRDPCPYVDAHTHGARHVRWRTEATHLNAQHPGSMTSSATNNLLLDRLSEHDRTTLTSVSDTVMLDSGTVLADAGRPITHAYFPIDSAIALLVEGVDQPRLEVGLVGREGMLGIPLVLGVPAATFRAVVQGAGSAWRIEAAQLAQQVDSNPKLRGFLLKYAHVCLVQIAHTAACKSFHRVEARLARWLLMSRDRARSNELALTHEVLACTLGVRRAGVTLAASDLQARRLIRYARGHIELLDARGLEAVACPCYAGEKRIYARFLR